MAEWKPTENDEDPILRCLQRPEGIHVSPNPVVQGTSSSNLSEKAEFVWIWILGKRVPSINVNGEPEIPLKIITNILSKSKSYDEVAFHDIMKTRSVHTKLSNSVKSGLLQSKCEKCRDMDPSTIELVNRSDIERILGDLRIESEQTFNENNYWNDQERFLVGHFNFCDYEDTIFESGDINENIYDSAVKGWFYPSRNGMRCVRCLECNRSFTPNDFSVHHHYQAKYDGVFHWGLNSNNWTISLSPVTHPKMTPSDLKLINDLWAQITDKGVPGTKRRHDLEKTDRLQRVLFETTNNLSAKKLADPIKNIEDNDEIIDVVTADDDIQKSKVQQKTIAIEQPMPSTSFDSMIMDLLKAAAGLKNIKETPEPKRIVFDAVKGEFQNLSLDSCSDTIKLEIELLSRGLVRNEKERRKADPSKSKNAAWQAVLKEQQLLKGLSEEAVKVLDGKLIEVQKPVPMIPLPIPDLMAQIKILENLLRPLPTKNLTDTQYKPIRKTIEPNPFLVPNLAPFFMPK